MSSADNLCKQFGHRSGPTTCQAWSGSKLFETMMVFLKEFFQKVVIYLLLIAFTNSLDPDQAQQNVGPNWIQSVWNSDGIPERIIQKVASCLLSSADSLHKQFGPRSGPTKCCAWSWSKLFDTLMVILNEYFKKVDFEKNHQTTKKFKITQHANI